MDACAALIDESSRRWREAEGNYRDDITAIVCRFPFFPAKSDAEVMSNGDDSYNKMNSYRIKPGASTLPVNEHPVLESAGVAGTSENNVEDNSQDAISSSTFAQRRLTLNGNIAETDDEVKRLEQLRQLHGNSIGPADDGNAP